MSYIIFAAFLVLADQLFKIWIVRNIPLGEETALIPAVMGLTNVRNEGAAFSLFTGLQLPIIILTILVCLAILVAFCLGRPRVRSQRFALALVLGGAIGNLLDRLLRGYVVDMFKTLFVDFAVFNIADCCIVAGGILFVVSVLFFSPYEKELKAIPSSEGEKEAVLEQLKAYKPEQEQKHDPADPG